jgi:GNAT superfamily N-acetyltransferase
MTRQRHIRKATELDVPELVEVAVRTFRDTFAAENSAEDLELFLKRTYTIDRQTAELKNANLTTLIAEVDGVLAAYAQLRWGPCPTGVERRPALELMRFYVDRSWHGQGLAHELMTAVESEARALGAATLWLGVWERNVRAISFYRKRRFVDVGSQIFLLGNDPQSDRVMSFDLTLCPPGL